MLKSSRKNIIIWSCYLIIFTLLVFYKFNFLLPTSENQFIFSGDFVRPITADSAFSYYLKPYVLSNLSSNLDVTAPLRVVYWALVLSFTAFLSLNMVYWLLIIGTHVGGALLVALASTKILKPKNHKNAIYIIPALFPAMFFLFSYPVNYRPYWLFLPLLPAILFFLLALNYEIRQKIHKIMTREKLILIGLGYLSIIQPHLYLLIVASISILIAAEVGFRKLHKLPISQNSSLALRTVFWYSIPFLVLLIPLLSLQYFYHISISPTYNYNLGVLKMMSINGDYLNAFTFSNGFWEKVTFTDLDKTLILFMVIGVLVTFLLFRGRTADQKSLIMAAVLTFAVMVTLELGYNNEFYRAIADPSFSLSWILRDPFKISLAALGLFLFVSTLALKNLLNPTAVRNRSLRLITVWGLIIPLIVSMIVWNPVQKTSELLQPVVIPAAYFDSLPELQRNGNEPVIFLPDAGTRFTWAENENLETSFLAMTYPGSSAGTTITANPYGKQLLDYALKTGDSSALDVTGGTVVIDKSLDAPEYADLIKQYTSDGTAKSMGDQLYYSVNSDFNSVRIQSGAEPIYLVGGRYSDIRYLPSTSYPVIFYDPTYSALKNAPTAEFLSLSSREGGPSQNWVKGYSHDPLHGEWHSYLQKMNIENWETDYDSGIAFTWAPKSLGETGRLEHPTAAWSFDSTNDLAQWKKVTAERQSGAVQSLDLQASTLRSTLWNHTSGWKIIKSPPMEVLPDHYYRIAMDIRGENTNHVHSKLVEFDGQSKVVSTKNLNVLGDGTFDWKSYTYDYALTDKNVKSIQLQIWHDNDVLLTLPTKIWIDNMGMYDVTNYITYESLEVPFATESDGDYRLLVRYLKNHEGGEIRLLLDGENFTLVSKDQLNKFGWAEYSIHGLQAGQHRITLQNIEGFNAVNLLVMIPENDYALAKESISRQMSEQNLLFVLDPNSNLHHSDATFEAEHDKQNVMMHFTEATRAWQEIEITSDGSYVLATNGIGTFHMTMGDQSFILNPNGHEAHSTPFSLSVGKHSLQIKSDDDASLESVTIYSTETLAILERSQEVNPTATVLSYEKASPVLWNINVRASEPFMITTAEFFDPLWEARIYVGDRLVEFEEPIQLYGALNGFVINSHDEDLRVVIQYKVQEGFEMAMSLSALGFAFCILYVFYDWRKDKGDTWATRISQKLSVRNAIPPKSIGIQNYLGEEDTSTMNRHRGLNA